MAAREQWRSGLGFVLAAAGSAVGLGNLWGFAYRVSQGGGMAFVLLYVLVVLLACLPVLVAETALGRSTGRSPLMAPSTAAGFRWQLMGWLFVAASCGVLAFYAVLMSWTGHTLLHALLVGLPDDIADAESFFASVSDGTSVVLGQLLSLLLTGCIVTAGVRRGIERLSRWGLPFLLLLLLALAIWASTLKGAKEGYSTFLLQWNPSYLSDPTTIRLAFSQAFFSIGTGIGCILAYATYLDRRNHLPREAVAIAGIDTIVGLLAGLVTFPIVASFGLMDVISESTVGTLFIALPTGLSRLGDTGRTVAVLFFALAYIAAITSAVSLLEVPVACLMDCLCWSRKRAVWLSVTLIFLVGLPSAISAEVLSLMDTVFGGLLLILGGLLLAILMGWAVPRQLDEDLRGCSTPKWVRFMLRFMLRWISPPIMAAGLLASSIDLLLSLLG
ncbi:sodium-dependent transporter [cyanobiont of Ornithocercus magnificus]|nr:sodium-dependent transporter [cyanobiont of Ornithocercus magnificus]